MATFVTPDGRVVPAVTADEMRTVDRVAVEDVGLRLLQLMENAGRNLAAVVRERLADADRGPVVVFAGAGGNGGGGLCAARHLSNHGAAVRVVLDRDHDALEGAAAVQRRVLRGTTVEVTSEGAPVGDAAVLVDALVGYGLTGTLTGRVADLVEACNGASAPVVSLDVPSGLDATTGRHRGPVVDAAETVTLALPKTGLAGVSDLSLADIGLPAGTFREAGIEYEQPFDDRDVVALEPT